MLQHWTAVIVNYNGAEYLGPCLRSLERTLVPPTDIVVVENASVDDSLQELHAFPRVNVLPQAKNLGFAGGANVGLASVDTELALLLNPDVEVMPDIGAGMIEAFSRDDRLGAAGALLLYPDSDRVQHAGGLLHRPLMTGHHIGYGDEGSGSFNVPRDVDFVTGGAMGLRMSAFRDVGGFDEQFMPAYYEDADFCLRLRASDWRVRFIPSMRAFHHEGVTLGHSPDYYHYINSNRIRFALKHLNRWEWAMEFVPAEMARIRHEISQLAGDDWAIRSGASAIESVLRAPTSPGRWDTGSAYHPSPPNALSVRIEPIRDSARRVARQDTGTWSSRQRLVNGLREKFLAVFIGTPIFEQREFNNRVVEALEMQDKLNREQTAALMLLALDILGRLRSRTLEETERRRE